MSKTAIYTSLIIILFIFSSCSDKKESKEMFSKQNVKQGKEFTLKTSNGEKIVIIVKDPHTIEIKTPKFKNKIILFDFWATWCPPCVQEIPHLVALAKKYKKDFEIIGVLSEANKDLGELKEFIKQHNIAYTITTTHDSRANLDLFAELTNLRSLPFKAMYDKNGKYIIHYYGAIPEEMLDIEIKKVLTK